MPHHLAIYSDSHIAKNTKTATDDEENADGPDFEAIEAGMRVFIDDCEESLSALKVVLVFQR